MGGYFTYDPKSGTGMYMSDEDVREAGGLIMEGASRIAGIYLISLLVAIVVVTPFLTVFLLDDLFNTIIANNTLFFLLVGALLAVLRLIPKTARSKAVRILFNVYVFVAGLYFLLYVVGMATPIYAYFRFAQVSLQNAGLSSVDVLGLTDVLKSVDGHWIYQCVAFCMEHFIEFVKWAFTAVANIDATVFSAPAHEIDIFKVIFTLLSYVGVGGFAVIATAVLAVLMLAIVIVTIILPYVILLVLILVINNLVNRLHTKSKTASKGE